MSHYRCKHFNIVELVSKEIYRDRGDKAWDLLDVSMLKVLDRLREKFGAITVNNWHQGGTRNWCGLRTPDSPDYKKYSQHSFGRAFDCLFHEDTVDNVRRYIIEHPEEFPEIGGIELSVSWLHIDGRNHDGILAFNP